MRNYWQLGALWLALLACGCASRQRCAESCCEGPVLLDCEVVSRQAIVPDVSAVAPRSTITFADRQYYNLPEADAQCLAATHSVLANLLEQESEVLAAQPKCLHCSRNSQQCLQRVLSLQAAHERNRTAAAALQIFLRLAEAEAGSDNLRLRLQEVDHLLSDVQRLQAAGVESALSRPAVEAQRLELVHKQIDLQATIEELNQQLVPLIGAEPPPESRLWPAAELKVETTVPSVDTAQSIALQQRADLSAARTAADCDLDSMRALLGQISPGLGSAPPGCKVLLTLHLLATHREGNLRSGQLQAAADEQERTIRHDVARAVTTIEARLAQIGLSRQRLDALQRQVERLQQKRQVDAKAYFEARQAKLEVLAADQDLLHDVIEWKIAVVKLRELQGELGLECGFSAAIDCE